MVSTKTSTHDSSNATRIRLLKESTEPADKVELTKIRIEAGIAEMGEWSYEAERAWEYYQSHQWQNMDLRERQRTIPIVANVIRRDVDQMTSRILDAEPVVNPKGRHQRYTEFGKNLVDVVAWTRDAEENWFNDLEDTIQDCFHAGEGLMMELWNQSAANGLGMPETNWIDPRYMCWDWHSREWQHGDAEWAATFIPKKVDYLEKKYRRQLDRLGVDRLTADFPTLHVSEQEREWLNRYNHRQRMVGNEVFDDIHELEDRAYERIVWEKKIEFETQLIDAETGRTIMVPDEENGGDRPATPEDELPPNEETGEKPKVREVDVEVTELWRTVVINDHLIEHEKSIYDKSFGGHGEFPFAWFSYVRVRGRSHAKGEIDYLVGIQDLINRSLARWLEQLMIAGSSFINSTRGSMAPEDDEKLENIGRVPLQVFRTFAGFNPPTIEGGNPQGAPLFASGYELLTQVKDGISGVYDVQRGGMPYQTSGRGIRALQSSTDLLGTLPRRHIESGLKQSTMLRIANIRQFMRGSRLADVIDRETGQEVPLYIGNTLNEIKAEFGLQVYKDPQTGKPAMADDGEILLLADAEGNQVRTMALGEKAQDGIEHTRITYELDTGKERNREERMEVAREFMQHLGPGAAEWAVEILDLPEKDRLMQGIERYNAVEGLLAQITELSKSSGMDEGEIIQMAIQDVQQAADAQKAQNAFGADQASPQAGGAPPQAASPAQPAQGQPQ